MAIILELYENEVENVLKLLEQLVKSKKDKEFNEFLAKINSEQSKVVFSTLYIPVQKENKQKNNTEKKEYNKDEINNRLPQIASKINNNEIPAGDYKIVRTDLINILTGEVHEGYALYDKDDNYIASIWENVIEGSGTKANVIEGSGTKAKEIVSKFVEKQITGKFTSDDNVQAIEVTLSNPTKILPLSLSVGTETKTLTEVVKNLESLGYIVHPNLLISDSGDVALLFFNDENSYKKFLEETKNLQSYEKYKQWLETGNETKNKHDVGFIFFREISPNSKRRPDSSFTVADSIASYMLDTLRLNTAKSIDKKKPEEKKQYVRDMREFFSLSRFVEYNLVRDKDNNITGVEISPNWYGHLFLKLISEKRYEGLEPVTFYKVYLPNHIKLSKDIVVKEDENGKYIEVPYHKNDFVWDMNSKILSYEEKIKEIIKGNIKSKENKELNSEEKEAMIKSIMNSAVVTKSFTDTLLKLSEDLADIIKKANLQYNAVRGNTFFHNKSIKDVAEIGSFFETNVMMPMPYLSAEINIKETSTTEKTSEKKKDGCALSTVSFSKRKKS